MNKKLFPTTELATDLKLYTREPGRMEMGVMVDGAIIRDGEDHFTFFQNVTEKKRTMVAKRNPIVYEGDCINIHRTDDGQFYPTFNRPRFTREFTFRDFCRFAAVELLLIAGIDGEMPDSITSLREKG